MECHLSFKPHQHKLRCKTCKSPYHRICLPKKIPRAEWTSTFQQSWTCSSCSSTQLSPSTNFSDILPHNAAFSEDDGVNLNLNIDVQLNLNLDLNNIEKVPPPNFMNGMRIGHLNCNGVLGKIDEIRHFLTNEHFTVSCFTESKLDQSTPSTFVTIPGYNLLQIRQVY